MNLPERQPYTAPRTVGDWPLEATAIVPAGERTLTPVPERRIVGYEQYAGGLMPVYEVVQPVQRTPARDLSPQPLVDPRAQVVLAGGVAAGTAGAGIGWGVGQAATGIATFGSSSAVVAFLVLLLVMKGRGAKTGSGDTTNIHVTNHNRWWGKSSSPIK